ncbi:MAG: phytanoyl-CoA dioxygenase family protein [Gemmatimonadetes bacterium]|nr:phytanoyl-CoA dioxygenase family protein [Gemmatimonadota bacterium]
MRNGCLWVIPGSHKWGRLDHVFLRETETFYAGRFAQDVDDKNQVPIEMHAGEIAIFHSHVLHRSGSNSSDKLRRSYICAYHHCNLTYLTDTGMKGAEFPILRKNKIVGD